MILRTEVIEQILTFYEVHPDNYPLVYNVAVDLYNVDKEKAPFGEDYIISAIKKLKSKPASHEVAREKREYNCTYCKDTGVEMKGLIPVVIEMEGKKVKMKCQNCQKKEL